MREYPPIEELKQVLSYDPESGIVRWTRNVRCKRAGSIAGARDERGYRRIGIRGSDYAEHRIAFALYYGRHPLGEIDHIDGNPSNNKISNLREVTRTQNLQNRMTVGATKSGSKRNPWKSTIVVNGRIRRLGRFKTLEEAQAAYRQAEREEFGEFACRYELRQSA